MKRLIILVVLLQILPVCGQSPTNYNTYSDLSISFGFGHKMFTGNTLIKGQTGRMSIEYRHPVKEKVLFVAGLSSHIPNYQSSKMSDYVMENDTDRVSRSFDLWGNQYSVNAGIDYYFTDKLYSVVRAQFGSSSPLIILKDMGESKPAGAPEKEWHASEAAAEYHNYQGIVVEADQSSPVLNSPYREFIGKSSYLGYGLELGVGYQHQITSVIQLAVQYTGIIRRYVFQKSEVNYDGPGDISLAFSSFNTFSQYLELTARIKFRTKADTRDS